MGQSCQTENSYTCLSNILETSTFLDDKYLFLILFLPSVTILAGHWTFPFCPLGLYIYFCQFLLNSGRFPLFSLSIYSFMFTSCLFLCSIYSLISLSLFFFNFRNVCRNRLPLQVWVAQTPYIPKKVMLSELTDPWTTPGNWALSLGLFFLRKAFLYDWGLGLHSTNFIVYAKKCNL